MTAESPPPQSAAFQFGSSFGPKVTSPYASEIVQDLSEVAVLPAVSFLLVWDKNQITRYTNELNEHIANHVNVNSLSMPGRDQSESDPRQYANGGRWRDEIRRQLKLPALLVDFASIIFEHLDEERILLTGRTITPWTDFITWLIGLPDGSEVTVAYTLMPLKDEEDPLEIM